jgi:hypothetical protein
LTDRWDANEDDERSAIVEQLGNAAREKSIDSGAVPIEVRPLSAEAKEVVLALLAHATEDSMRYQGTIEWQGALSASDPRIGDIAVWSLHQMEPDHYIFTGTDVSRQREAERIAAANVWRKAHGRELLLQPDRPHLGAEQALRIVNITIEPAAMKVDKEFDTFLDAFVGTNLDEQTLPKILRHFTRSVVEGSRGIEVEARRANDLTGVSLSVRLQPGRAEPAIGWIRNNNGRIGKTDLSGFNGSVPDDKMKSDDAWQDFAANIRQALPVPPEAEIYLRASLLNYPP